MVTLGYDGSKAKPSSKRAAPHFVMVGKGVTFDTGGISIKPSPGMWEMKSDMAGAGTVLGALCAIAVLKLPIKASAVLCLAENRPGNAAVLPGDIFTAKNGKTIMVDNTDAEGRLILTDGLAEAGALGATHIVDLATLTGAIVRAIGPSIAGMFSNDAGFTQTMFQAAESAGEKFCVLPLEEEYREYLDDPVADMKNVGKQEAGAITAALFLQEFVPAQTAWSHWDIAGTAFTTSPWKYYRPGGTGWGVKTLVEVARALSAG
jgi:leucyl aminopeptidase